MSVKVEMMLNVIQQLGAKRKRENFPRFLFIFHWKWSNWRLSSSIFFLRLPSAERYFLFFTLPLASHVEPTERKPILRRVEIFHCKWSPTYFNQAHIFSDHDRDFGKRQPWTIPYANIKRTSELLWMWIIATFLHLHWILMNLSKREREKQ